MSNRIVHIDVAKGISIALVAMFHSKLRSHFPEVIEPMGLFRMPLFFFLSGMFFSYGLPPKKFLWHKAEALLKPYFSVLLLAFIINVILQDKNLLWQIKGIFYGNGDTIKWTALWFLTHLFTVYCFSYCVFRFTGFSTLSKHKKLLVLLVFLSIGSIFIKQFWYIEVTVFGYSIELPGLPFSIDLILLTSTYFISGYLLREAVIKFSPTPYLLVISLVMFMLIVSFTEAHLGLNSRNYSSPVFATLGAISGSYIILCISYWIAEGSLFRSTFLMLGNSSLYILLFHGWIGDEVYRYASAGVDDNHTLVLLAALAFLLSIFLPIFVKLAVNRNDYLALIFLPIKSNKLFKRAKDKSR